MRQRERERVKELKYVEGKTGDGEIGNRFGDECDAVKDDGATASAESDGG